MRVILVFFDTMRHDHAGCYGYPKPTTPNLDRLAAEGMVFDNCYATDTPTQPCYTATMTGKRGITTGVVSHGQGEDTIPSRGKVTFPQVLAENGVQTAAVSTLYRFRRWFAHGFSHYVQPSMATWLQHVTARQVNDAALPWLKAYGQSGDFFMFLHYWDPHSPYHQARPEYVDRFYGGGDPRDPANRSLDDLRSRKLMNFFITGGAVPELNDGITDFNYPVAEYDAEIFTADEGFGEVLATLDDLKILDDTMIVFTADHGESMNEHGVYFDHMDAYEQTSHVPLIVWRPGTVKPGRSDAMVQHIDFAPTILEAFGVRSVPADLDGLSLMGILKGGAAPLRDAAVTNHGLWSAARAMRTSDWSIVRTLNPGMLEDRKVGWELFDRRSDQAEAHDVAAEQPEAFEAMKARYLAWMEENLGSRPDPLRAVAAQGTAAESVKRRYKELGGVRAKRAVTPKDRADIDHAPKG